MSLQYIGSLMVHVGRYEFSAAVLPSLLTAACVAGFVLLGVWQLERAEQKARSAERFTAHLGAPPVRLDVEQLEREHIDPAAWQDVVVELDGRYDSAHQFLLDNRVYRGRAGYHVLTPLIVAGSRGVLVNRGWVALGETRGDLPDIAVSEDPVRVRGQGFVPRQDQLVLGDAGYTLRARWPRVVQRVELPAMEKLLGYRLLPFSVRLAPGQADGFIREWTPFAGIGPQRHRAYALQWFSFAVVLIVIYVGMNLRRGTARAAR